MGFNFIERLVIVLTHSWKAQMAALITLAATLGSFLIVQHATFTLAQSTLASEVALTAHAFHAEWLAAGLVLFGLLLSLSELFQHEWRRIYDQL